MSAPTGTQPEQDRGRQQERSRITRQRLLDATVACLVTYGWSGTTTTLIADSAGVSRGAQLHHFPTKTSLVLAAVEYLTERRAIEIRDEAPAGAANVERRVERVLDLLGASFTGPLYQAALEVWVAARTDDALRRALVPLEAKIGRELFQLTATLLDADTGRTDVRDAIQATLELLRGLGVANLLGTDTRRSRAVLDGWSRHLATVLERDQPRRDAIERRRGTV
jgi:AcrR family transcriptional regulator